ncbi:TlpA family protein disulfide reductase [Maribacter sp. MAR_2009_72]|uniref:TlpA family protein disulfide reductase n=1 Tax=Maribacter sp. MAR_2009_72 TaxID=1250050 RepID=UPI00119C770C|nr:TlpA disulfide reductase family protein [Maribacter sp. MAR_2009_72]TVZ16089.1 thiol-disulfide isomerase/thioredoxin [Maribacter sp. MAR_2009_72]
MKKRKFKISDIIFAVFIVLLLIPQTRTPIQVAVNKLKVVIWSPSIEDQEDQQQIAAFDYAVTDLQGASQHIPVARDKVVFLSYWATWCPPCIAELPGIQELYKDYGDKITFVLLTQEEPAKVLNFVARKEYQLPIYFPQMQAPEILNENSLPTNYVIDAQGRIMVKETGAADWNSTKIRSLLDELIAEPMK